MIERLVKGKSYILKNKFYLIFFDKGVTFHYLPRRTNDFRFEMTIEEYNICVEKFADGIYRFVLKNLKDADRSQDIVQDCFEKLWLKYSNVSYEKAKSYLFTTAYHTMIDDIRKQNRFIENGDVMAEPFHTKQYNDVSEVLHQALEILPQDQKSALLLRDYEGYSYQEIEEITGLSASQVKVYIYRARMALKEYLGSIEIVL